MRNYVSAFHDHRNGSDTYSHDNVKLGRKIGRNINHIYITAELRLKTIDVYKYVFLARVNREKPWVRQRDEHTKMF